MNIEFLSTVAVIAPDPPASRKLYVDALGLPLESEGGDYYHSEQITGSKSFGIWPLSQAAERASGQRIGQRSGRCRRSASSSTSWTPRRWARRHESSSRPDRAAAPAAAGAVGSDGGQAAVTGGRNRRALVRACAPRRGLTEDATCSIDATSISNGPARFAMRGAGHSDLSPRACDEFRALVVLSVRPINDEVVLSPPRGTRGSQSQGSGRRAAQLAPMRCERAACWPGSPIQSTEAVMGRALPKSDSTSRITRTRLGICALIAVALTASACGTSSPATSKAAKPSGEWPYPNGDLANDRVAPASGDLVGRTSASLKGLALQKLAGK